MKTRGWVKTTYSDGTVEIFDPLVRWRFLPGWAEIGLRGDYAVGVMWQYTVGSYSCFKEKWLEIFGLTFYVKYGRRSPYNPRTGKSYA